MQEFLQFALLGLGVGSLYSLASQGLLIIYRGSGVLNFAYGAIGMCGAFVWWDLSYRQDMAFLPAMVIGILVSALIGALIQLLVMRPLRRAAPLVRLVATLGVLIVLQSIAVLRYGTDTQIVTPSLPTDQVTLFGQVAVGADRLILLGIAAVLTGTLYYVYKYTRFGVGTSAVAGNERASAALGWSPNTIALANWILGSALAGAAAILIAPIVQLQVSTMTTLTLAAMSAALVASFRSFPVAFLAGIGVGVAQTLAQHYVDTPGFSSSLPFAVIVVVLLVRGTSLPARGHFLQRLPRVGSGQVRPVWLLVATAVAVAVIASVSAPWLDAFSVTIAASLVLLSVVVVTGYTGQISLAQFAVAGMGAYVAGRLVAGAGWSFLPAVFVGILAAVPIGALFAIPAVRTRGITLAIMTLGMGTTIEQMIFNNPSLTGGYSGTTVGSPVIFGMSFDAAEHPVRFTLLCLGTFVFAALMVGNLRRGRTGRRMLAVRTNERAAAALGIGVATTKLYAFGVAGAVAAMGGILLGFKSSTIVYSTYTSIESITYVGYAVIGGLGYLLGPIFGAGFVAGGLGTVIANEFLSTITRYIPLIGGGVLILTVLGNQDGIAHAQVEQIRALTTKLRRGRADGEPQESPESPTTAAAIAPGPAPAEPAPSRRKQVRPQTLEVDAIGVRYGGVTAVEKLSLTVRPGRITGLIGPNGAGKTSAIDAISGFLSPAEGGIKLDGKDIHRQSAAARSRAGLSRSFQSLELFEDLTVIDNLRTASDRREWWSGLSDLAYPRQRALPAEVEEAIDIFHLRDLLDQRVEDLPYGQRRLVAIARAVATQPSVLLLDEPAAGLGERESMELAALVRSLPDEWGMGLLLVEHDMDFVMSVCDEIIVLDFGKTIASGVPQDIRRDPAVIAAYLGETEEEMGTDPPSVTVPDGASNV